MDDVVDANPIAMTALKQRSKPKQFTMTGTFKIDDTKEAREALATLGDTDHE